MRTNNFGEKIAQPDDTHDQCMLAWEFPAFTYAEVDTFGGKLKTDEGHEFSFDGFENVEDAREFAEQFVPAWEVSLC